MAYVLYNNEGYTPVSSGFTTGYKFRVQKMDVEKAVHGLTIGLVSVSNQKEGMPKLNVGSFDLGDHDRDWFIVMSRLGDRSIRANLSSVVGYYVRRRKSEYEAILDYTARKYGLTPEECFKKLLNGEDLGKPVDGFSEPPPEVPEEG